MATKKQKEANRRNAAKSTGPRTAAGKARASKNAVKHGLLSQCPVLSDEDAGAYEELRMNLHGELEPETPFEMLLVNRLVSVQWRLARVPQVEAELIERMRHDPLGNDDGLGAAWTRDAGPYGGALARLARYETTLERSIARLMEELRRRRRERRARDKELAQQPPAGEAGPWWERAAAGWPGAPAARSPELPIPGDGGNMGWPFIPAFPHAAGEAPGNAPNKPNGAGHATPQAALDTSSGTHPLGL
jgi:hypothetical protein